MKVLYIDGVGPFGGASRSLYEAMRAMPPGAVDAYFLIQRGTVLPYYGELARDVIATRGLTRFDNTRYGHYRGARWLIVLRELFHLPYTLIALIRARRRWGTVDLIHANEITEIVPLLFARFLFRAPTVVHVRSLTQNDPASRRTRWLHSRLRHSVSAVVAIDANVRSTLPADVPVDIIHNSFAPVRSGQADASMLQRLETLRSTSLKVGFVGNLHHSKGLFDLLEAARIIHTARDNVDFVVVGGTTRRDTGPKGWLLRSFGFAQNVEDELRKKITEYGLTQRFHLLGPTPDIQRVYESLDVLCFPSHLDAPGRPVFEAAFSSVPCIAAIGQPMPDTLIDGETGIAIPGKSPDRLAAAILHFANDRREVERMGANARRLAEANFSPTKNARKLYDVYDRITRSVKRTTPNITSFEV